MKLLEENVGKRLQYMGDGGDFLKKTQKAQETKGKLDKWDYIKFRSFYI